MNTRTKETVIDEIINYFEENEAAFIACMEELDSYNGYLGDDRYFEMEELDQLYLDQPHMERFTELFMATMPILGAMTAAAIRFTALSIRTVIISITTATETSFPAITKTTPTSWTTTPLKL